MTLRTATTVAPLALLLGLLAAPPAAHGQNATAATTGSTAPGGSPSAPRLPANATGSSGGGPAATAAPAPGGRAPIDVQLVPMPGTSVQAGRVSTVFDAPFDVVAGVITDFAHYHEFLPRVTESRIVRRRRGEADVYLQVPLLQNLGTIWALTRFRITRAPDRVVVDGRQANGNVARFECRFEATPVPGTNRTQVTLQILAIPAFPWPTGLLGAQQGRWGARGLEAMRDRAERLAVARVVSRP